MDEKMEKKHRDQIDRLVKNVEDSYTYFQQNYSYWHKMKRFIYVSTLDEYQRQALVNLKKPELEFNILEAYISRLRGEFCKSEPNFEISSITSSNQQIFDIVEGHIKFIENESRKNGVASEIFEDMLSGGFSVAKVCTKYKNPKSFSQEIKFKRVNDPTMCGFDPVATLKTKADAKYCFELYPKFVKEVEEEFNIDLSDISQSSSLSGFSWSRRTSKNEHVILLCDYYEFEKKRIKFFKLSTDDVVTADDYKSLINNWNELGFIEQPPVIVDEKYDFINEVVRYQFIKDKVLSREKTDYKYLPLVFFDGNSVTYRPSNFGPNIQVTRSYVHQAIGVQKLKDFSGQSQAAELENMVQNKFIAPIEAIPSNNIDPWRNPQDAEVLLYNQFLNNDPNVRLDQPREIARADIPQSIMYTFTSMDQMSQQILGNYDATLGINKKEVSGKAIQVGAIQTNAVSEPYISSYIDGLNQISRIFLDLIPKYLIGHKSLPIIDKKGNKRYVPIEKDFFSGVDFEDIEINVEAGANFQVQKDLAVQKMIGLMNASESFASFINAKGIPVLLDNIDFRGSDRLKILYDEYQAELVQAQKAQSEMAQQAMQNDPMWIAAQNDRMRLQVEAAQNDVKNRQKAAELVLDQEKVLNERLKTVSQIKSDRVKDAVSVQKVKDERISKAVDVAVKEASRVKQQNLTN